MTKAVTARSGHLFKVDISDEACQRFGGFKSGDRFICNHCGCKGVVEGVFNNVLWVTFDSIDTVVCLKSDNVNAYLKLNN